MTDPASTPQHFIGCDVSKDTIALFDQAAGIARTIPNRPAALKAWAGTLDPSTAFVVCETTGGYETDLLEACYACGVRAHRAHARQVKAFITSHGMHAKTDAIDARALAGYGCERHARLGPWQPADPASAALYTLVQRRREVVTMKTAEKNRIQSPGSKAVRAYIADIIRAFQCQIRQIDADIKKLAAKHKPIAERVKKISAVKGLGPVAAPAIIALMPELGTLTRRQTASLAGLAPHPRQSGTRDAYRKTKGGRPEVKAILFMSTLVAIRHNPNIRPFYERLIKNGKKPMVAITAAMRKLITILNAILRPESNPQVS